MAYESVDKLQNALGEQVFHYTQDKKKAAGRALGTMIEIITYYLLKTWGFNNSTSIERGLVEYGNDEISHNVEYSLHPIINEYEVTIPNDGNSIVLNGTDFPETNGIVRIYDATGRIVFTERIAVNEAFTKVVLFDNQLKSGLYVVELTVGNDRTTARLIVQ